MFLWIFQLFESLGIKIPFVFTNFSTRMILSAITTLFITIWLGPWFIKKLYELKVGQKIRSLSECPLLNKLHEKKKDTPTMGGLLILFSCLISLFLWMDLMSSFTWILLFSTVFLGVLGGVDDYLKLKHKNTKGLSAKKKFLGQVLFSSILALYLLCPIVTETISGNRAPIAKEYMQKEEVKTLSLQEYTSKLFFPFIKKPVLEFSSYGLIFHFILILIVIIGTSNAVNLTDGLDGLATGCLVMVAAVLALFAFLSNHVGMASYLNILYIEGSGEIAIYLFALSGALLGFLWYNGYPAQVFMGDIGSLALGGIMGVCAVLLRREFLLALVGGIFVVEALSVIIQVISFRYRKKRVFLCSPLHHHFEYKGWPETKVVIRFWIVGLILAIIGIASLKFQ